MKLIFITNLLFIMSVTAAPTIRSKMCVSLDQSSSADLLDDRQLDCKIKEKRKNRCFRAFEKSLLPHLSKIKNKLSSELSSLDDKKMVNFRITFHPQDRDWRETGRIIHYFDELKRMADQGWSAGTYTVTIDEKKGPFGLARRTIAKKSGYFKEYGASKKIIPFAYLENGDQYYGDFEKKCAITNKEVDEMLRNLTDSLLIQINNH